MKKTINEQIEQKLERLVSLSPDAVEAFFSHEWNPFIESLPSESDKVLAFELLWQRQVENLKLIAAHIPALSDAEFEKIAPQLKEMVSARESILTRLEAAPAPAA